MLKHLFVFCIILFIAGIHCQRTSPFTAEEYVNSLGYGFDTDIFKETPPLRKYNNINNKLTGDLKKLGVGHLRLRSRADVFGYKTSSFDPKSMNEYFISLDVVVNDLIKANIFPIISWIHHDAEAKPTAQDGTNYVDWWRRVAERSKNYSYELSFNLFTEIDDGPLRDPAIYNNWTERAIEAIRSTGGYNKDRIIILGAPGKKADSLFTIKSSIYENKTNIACEWHLYASGPNKEGGQKNWAGTGSASDKANVDSVMDEAVGFTKATRVPTWIGAWMPYDNIGASQNQAEIEAFACYFAEAAFKRKIPWAMNKLDNFYDTKTNSAIQSEDIGRYKNQITLNLPKILNSSLCAIRNNYESESKICSLTCQNQNCLGSSLSSHGFSLTCNCNSCQRPCTVTENSPCLYPFDKCLEIKGENLCIVRDSDASGKWNRCRTSDCPARLNIVPLNPQEIKALFTQANE